MNDMVVAQTFSLVPQNLSQAIELSKLIADSDLAPKDYKGKPGNVLVAVQLGQEVGLAPMAAIQNIAVINGKPGLYGDAGKAILLSRGFIIEEDDIETIRKTHQGRCRITRPGHPPCERTFSMESAKVAGLIGKSGPWTTYPERMLAWRAFWFAARDIASDVLKGLGGIEELRDIPLEKDITPMEPPKIEGPQQYPDADFDKNFPIWVGLITLGKKPADDIIKTVRSKWLLSDEQEAKIRAVKVAPTTPLDDVKAICKAAVEIRDVDTAFAKIDEARMLLKEMTDENKALAVVEIDAAMALIKGRGE